MASGLGLGKGSGGGGVVEGKVVEGKRKKAGL